MSAIARFACGRPAKGAVGCTLALWQGVVTMATDMTTFMVGQAQWNAFETRRSYPCWKLLLRGQSHESPLGNSLPVSKAAAVCVKILASASRLYSLLTCCSPVCRSQYVRSVGLAQSQGESCSVVHRCGRWWCSRPYHRLLVESAKNKGLMLTKTKLGRQPVGQAQLDWWRREVALVSNSLVVYMVTAKGKQRCGIVELAAALWVHCGNLLD